MKKPVPPQACDVLAAASQAAGVTLAALMAALRGAERVEFAGFQQCYAEVAALAAFLNAFGSKVVGTAPGPRE